MKKFNYVLLLSLALLLIVGCAKDDLFTPADDQETISLKSGMQGDAFTGICEYVGDGEPGTTKLLPNGKTNMLGFTSFWYDKADDWRVTGNSTWYANYFWEGEPFISNAKVWGKAELFVDGDRGKWEISWHGYITDNGLKASVEAVGTGKEGEVKGLVAKWTYTLDILTYGFEYQTTGVIK